MNRLKKIVVIGPESTGKSTLCQQLSTHFKTDWVKEYAREYLLTNGNKYTYENLLDIAKGQIEKEVAATKIALDNGTDTCIFIDTDIFYCICTYRHQSFFISLTCNFYITCLHIQVTYF